MTKSQHNRTPPAKPDPIVAGMGSMFPAIITLDTPGTHVTQV